jgi:hypothetical protein
MLRQWFRSSFDKLDLLGDYFRAAYPQWHEILWGASVPAAIFFIAWSLGLPKNWAVVLWFIVAWSLAGYYVWRAVHIRFVPKLSIVAARFQDTPVTNGSVIVDNRTFVQLVPKCLTESPVYECMAYLQRVDKRIGQDQWEETSLDKNLILHWGEDKRELHPQSEQSLNVFFIQHNTNQIIPNLKPDADIPLAKFDSILMREPILRFYVQVTCSDRMNGSFVSIQPVRVCLEVRFVGPNRFRPQLELTQVIP